MISSIPQSLRRSFVFETLKRVNPVLPPKRKRETAARWACAVRFFSAALPAKQTNCGDWFIGKDMLTAASRCLLDPFFAERWAREIGDYAHLMGVPFGGVERSVGTELAKFIIKIDTAMNGEFDREYSFKLAAWKNLYPMTMAFCSGESWAQTPALNEAERIVNEEWELIYETEELFRS